MAGKIYKGYYQDGRVFPGESAMPFDLDPTSINSYNLLLKSPLNSLPLFPDGKGRLIEFRITEILGWTERGGEIQEVADYIWPFKRIR